LANNAGQVTYQVTSSTQLSGDAAAAQPVRVFISYKRGAEPDEQLALALYEGLKNQYVVFIDQLLVVGARWAACIEEELRRTDFLITLLSTHSVTSEMVLAEVETAHRLGREQQGRPVILPVRVAYSEPFR
jgi:hypothetical protein